MSPTRRIINRRGYLTEIVYDPNECRFREIPVRLNDAAKAGEPCRQLAAVPGVEPVGSTDSRLLAYRILRWKMSQSS